MKNRLCKKQRNLNKTVPFTNVSDAWFWFMSAQEARNSGARVKTGVSSISRPCEPVDILLVLDRLYRERRLQRDHLLVLRHYGRRKMAPDANRVKERRASTLWAQAMAILEKPLVKKEIVETVSLQNDDLLQQAELFGFSDAAISASPAGAALSSQSSLGGQI